MARQPKSVEIRSYQVGFGDCFLLSFVYSDKDKRHVLIDFGTTELPARAGKASQHMPKIAKAIADVCGKRGLTAVVATHRHADHISGFATDTRSGKSGDIIRGLKPKVVLQPWTEDPDAARNAKAATRNSSRTRKGFVASLDAMHDVAEFVRNEAARRTSQLGPTLARQLHFLGEDNIKNRSAVDNLIAMGKATTAVWARFGSKSGLERHLPGVKVRVLGPPDLTQTEKIRTMRKRDPDQFWHLLGDGLQPPTAASRRGNGVRPSRKVPAEARWFRDHLVRMRGEQLLEIVRSLDDQMNNTSLILLFEVFGKKLLFPGDAQIENWSYALQDAPNARAIGRLLEGVDVYKVGHHGSLNATPKTLLWERFENRKKAGKQRLKTLLSTMPGKHGTVARKTEVPRRPLLTALQEETVLANTHTLKFGADDKPWHQVDVTP